MKYIIGQQLFYYKYGEVGTCKVISLLEKTKRYRIEYVPSWSRNGKTDIMIMGESLLYPSFNECIYAEMDTVIKQIASLQNDMVRLQGMRSKATEERLAKERGE